jgi:predicted transcriptional regulator
MRILWSRPGISIETIMSEVPPGLDWSKSTVKTLLTRLVQKEMLATVGKSGRSYLYQPQVEEDAVIDTTADDVLMSICEMKQNLLIEDLIRKSQLTVDDIQHLKATLDHVEPVTHKHCNCLQSNKHCSC